MFVGEEMMNEKRESLQVVAGSKLSPGGQQIKGHLNSALIYQAWIR